MMLSAPIIPVILVGGGGTRLWPLSRPGRPKQFAPLVSADSMLNETLRRVGPGQGGAAGLAFAPPILVGAARQARLLAEEVAAAGSANARLLLEPAARNTAPAIAAAAVLVAETDPDALLLVLPADHHIRDLTAFHTAIAAGAAAARTGAIVTFGIIPDQPETGYGYIRSGAALAEAPGAFHLDRFVEKPDRATAETYLKEGTYAWNAGIFLAGAQSLIKAFERHAGDILQAARRALPAERGPAIRLDRAAFAAARPQSIDIAVMEQVEGAAVVPVDMGWSDVGSWASLAAATRGPGADQPRGRVIAIGSDGAYLRADRGLVAAIGVPGLAVIRDGDTVLVTHLAAAQGVKQVAEQVFALSERRDLAATPTVLADAARRYGAWLRDDVAPAWSAQAWDDARGGFREQLALDGAICEEPFRRVRVQARQLFAVSMFHLLGWGHEPLALAEKGFAYLTTKAWQAEGGWCHKLTPDGAVADPMRDLYDHAFVAFALAWYHRASGDPAALAWARRTLAYVDAALIDPVHGGFTESVPPAAPRRANPHMHLLEACLALFDATADFTYLDRADDLVALFSRHFFDPATTSVCEAFDTGWRPQPGDAEREPGHAFEWAWLISEHRRRLGSGPAEAAGALIAAALRHGIAPDSGLAWDAVAPDSAVLRRTHRIWPQTEAVRALAQAAHEGDAQAGPAAARCLEALMAHHLKPAAPGMWIDQVDAAGAPLSGRVPASSLYHLMTLGWEVAPLLAARQS